MANVFKRKRRVKCADGRMQVRKSACYCIEYRDSNGITRRVRGYTDLLATQQKAAELERLAARTDTGLVDPCMEHKKRALREHASV